MKPRPTSRPLLAPFFAVCLALTAGPALAATEATIMAIQDGLVAMGFDPGTPDGVAGSNTERAIKAFQTEFGYAATGEASETLLDQINAAAAGGTASPERLLAREGLLRSYTRAVQQGLTDLGYDPGSVDGALGPLTRTAVREYQTATGLSATGEISKPLLSSINTALGR
ncbi:MAG: peptidoglycan-binding protein [Rhodospirillales bacterium]|nr:peptidoglycan-binding protein [Rhodospirillales bacterium]